ncbi:MAG: hypothetical protein ACFFE4_02985 [Candidatus Thorarchaeota archaeon]
MTSQESGEKKLVKCCVINCQREIPLEDAIKIKDNYFCKMCGVAYYRSSLNI